MVTKTDVKSAQARMENADKALAEAIKNHTMAEKKLKKSISEKKKAMKEKQTSERIFERKKDALAKKVSAKIKNMGS